MVLFKLLKKECTEIGGNKESINSLVSFGVSSDPAVAQMVKNLFAMQDAWVRSLEDGMATHPSILA